MAAHPGLVSAALLLQMPGREGLSLVTEFPGRLLVHGDLKDWLKEEAGHWKVRHSLGDTGLLLVQLPAGQSPASVIDAVEAESRVETIEVRQEGDRRVLELTLHLPHGELAQKIVSKLADVDNVLEVRWAD